MSKPNSAHTPWRLDVEGDLETADGRMLAVFLDATDEEVQQMLAAPDILAALETALPFIVNDSPGGCTGEYSDCAHCAAIVKARAAIAKAKAGSAA
jgi:hypothetical protein